MVTFVAQKPSFSSRMMFILGKKSYVKPQLILGKFLISATLSLLLNTFHIYEILKLTFVSLLFDNDMR